MTLLGKILLFANLVLSLIMAAWGIALYTGRVNWTDKAATDAPQGELSKVVDKTKQQNAVVAAADGRYREAAAQLKAQQAQRAYNLSHYQFRAYHLQMQATDQDPAIAPVLDKGLAIVVQQPTNDNPFPIQIETAKDRAGDPLRSYAAYVTDLLSEHAKIKAEAEKLDAVNKKYLELSEQIVVKPGLRQLLQDEETKGAKVLAEIEQLRPVLVNAYIEIQLLAKRHDQLKNQVKGLNGNVATDEARKVGTGVDK
jgi:hypothetical protein